ncbi:hypothetical protein BJ742DRAFT_786835 [Cladochytrium replicatum]|nr:hypothetical protein BJ742DRAFT_786835 [Cladochytrium replicatum]
MKLTTEFMERRIKLRNLMRLDRQIRRISGPGHLYPISPTTMEDPALGKRRKQFPFWIASPGTQGLYETKARNSLDMKQRRSGDDDALAQLDKMLMHLRKTQKKPSARIIEENTLSMRNEEEAETSRLKRTTYLDGKKLLETAGTEAQRFKKLSDTEQKSALRNFLQKVRAKSVSNSESAAELYHPAIYPVVVSKLMRDCSRMGRSDLSEQLLGSYMQDIEFLEGLNDNVKLSPFHQMISILCRSGQFERAVDVYQLLPNLSLAPNSKMIASLIIHCSSSEIEFALRLLETLCSSSSPSLTVTNKIIELCLNSGEIQYAEIASTLLDQLRAKQSVQGSPRQFHRSTMLILIRNATSLSALEGLFEDTRKMGLSRFAVIQRAYLNALTKIVADDGAFSTKQILAKILEWVGRFRTSTGARSSDRMLNEDVARIVIGAYAKAEEWAGATGMLWYYLDHLPKSAAPNRTKFGRQTLNILKSIQDIHRDGSSRRKRSEQSRLYKDVWRVWNGLQNAVISPSRNIYAALIVAMGRTGDVRGVRALYGLLCGNILQDPNVNGTELGDTSKRTISPLSALDPILHSAVITSLALPECASDINAAIKLADRYFLLLELDQIVCRAHGTKVDHAEHPRRNSALVLVSLVETLRTRDQMRKYLRDIFTLIVKHGVVCGTALRGMLEQALIRMLDRLKLDDERALLTAGEHAGNDAEAEREAKKVLASAIARMLCLYSEQGNAENKLIDQVVGQFGKWVGNAQVAEMNRDDSAEVSFAIEEIERLFVAPQ